MTSWQLVWRNGFAKVISTKGLEALREALRTDDIRLAQGCSTSPPPLLSLADEPCQGACAISLCGWLGEDLATVGQVEEYFAKMCYESDQKIGEPAASRWLLNWFDDSPRHEVRLGLLAEVEQTLEERNDS